MAGQVTTINQAYREDTRTLSSPKSSIDAGGFDHSPFRTTGEKRKAGSGHQDVFCIYQKLAA
jgi:hypothetical protein